MGPGYGLNKRMRLIDVPADVVVVAGIQDLTLMLGTSSSLLHNFFALGSLAARSTSIHFASWRSSSTERNLKGT